MADEKMLTSDDDKSAAEDDRRLSAYTDFIMNAKTELISVEKFSNKNDHGTSAEDAVDKFEIFNRAFTKIENDANSKPLYKSIRVDIKELSPIKCQLLAKGRQKAHDKNLKQEIYWATTEKRADDEMSADTKVEKLSFKDVWEDLVHMKSTKQFCKYLVENPDLEKPKYLADVGFFNSTLSRKKELDRKSSHENTKSFFPRF